MATWADIQAHMRATYKLQEDEPEVLRMMWTYEDDRSQKVTVRCFQAFDREMVEVKSAFALRESVDPTVVLEENSKLPLATIALSGNVYLVVYNALMESLTLEDLDFLLSRVAGVADTLEEKYVQTDFF
jgi:hypothetical protein